MRRVYVTLIAAALLLGQVLVPFTPVSAAAPDYALPNGHFYAQANGRGGVGGTGYAVVDAVENLPKFGRVDVPFDSAFRSFGGVPILGYPASRVTVFPDFPIQVCQKLVLQFQPGRGVFFLNTFDLLHDRGFDAYLDSVRSIPPPFDTSADTGLSWAQVVARHQALLNQDAPIRALYFSVADPVSQFGLPVSSKDYGNVFVVRAQRAAFQHWKVDVGPNRANSVTIVNGGDVGKEVNLFPADSVVPVGPPSWSDNLVVLQPGASQVVHQPITVSGYARLYEAQGSYELKDRGGNVLAHGGFTAAIGTSPDFGRFDVRVPYDASSRQPGTLTLYSLSPADGTRVNVVNVPLTLAP